MNVQRNQYLRDVETRLQRLPQVDREQEMVEITQHLDSLIAARQSDGQTETAATQSAIAQFGTAREIGGALTQAAGHGRFAPIWEIVLFCAPVAALLNFFWFAFLCSEGVFYWSFDSYSDTPMASALRFLFSRYGAYFIGWLIGVIACVILIVRRAARKPIIPSARVNAAARWMLLNFLFGKIVPLLITRALVVPTEYSLLNAYGSAQFFYNCLWLLVPWASAYLVGRTSKTKTSVANSIGIASVLDVIYMMLFLVIWSVVWSVGGANSATAHKSFLATLHSFAWSFGAFAFWGIVNLFITRFFVRWGETSRSLSGQKKANYETAKG